MELWDLYDLDRMPLGKTLVRGAEYGDGEYSQVVHICMFNGEGKMLLQQRQPFKEGWSNMWDITVGGSAITGETSRMAAHRELSEEVGIDYDFTNTRPAFTINLAHAFDDFYIIEGEPDISALRLQPEEVQAVRWGTMDEILGMIDAGIFIPYHKSFIRFIFDFRTNGRMRSRRDDTVPAGIKHV